MTTSCSRERYGSANAPAGSFYAIEAADWLGLGAPGAVRAGMAPYTNADDVDRLIDGIREIAAASR